MTAPADLDKLNDSVSRLRAWISNYGDQKSPCFIADLTHVLDELCRLRKASIITPALEAEFRLLRAHNDRLRILLRQVETLPLSGYTEPACPFCASYSGHRPDCQLKAALEGKP